MHSIIIQTVTLISKEKEKIRLPSFTFIMLEKNFQSSAPTPSHPAPHPLCAARRTLHPPWRSGRTRRRASRQRSAPTIQSRYAARGNPRVDAPATFSLLLLPLPLLLPPPHCVVPSVSLAVCLSIKPCCLSACFSSAFSILNIYLSL